MKASTSLWRYLNNFPTMTTGSPRPRTVRGFILNCPATSCAVSNINARLPRHVADQERHRRRDNLQPHFHAGNTVSRHPEPLGELGLCKPHRFPDCHYLFLCHVPLCSKFELRCQTYCPDNFPVIRPGD